MVKSFLSKPAQKRLVLVFAGVAILAAGFAMQVNAGPERWKREGWKTDFSRTSIEWPEILSGGPPRDGIPSIDNPKFRPLSDITDMAPADPVIGLEINGDARAYPLSIMIWHEIVNDTVGGIPVSVTYCPLCNSSIVFDRRHDGQTLDFGTTGKLRNSDLVMYDRQTETWWQQFTGEGIAGTYNGDALKTFPARLESFENFSARHPKGQVLVPNDPYFRRYGKNPYTGYDRSGTPFLFRGELPKDIQAMARVVVFRSAANKPVAVALTHLRDRKNLTVEGTKLSWQAGQASALDSSRISNGRDVGNVVVMRRGADGTLSDIQYDVTFAFVFNAFHPGARIIQND